MANFVPFNQTHFRELERQFRELQSPIPSDHDFRRVPRGYAEINTLFDRSVVNGRGRGEVRIQRGHISERDHRLLADLQADLMYDIATIANRMDIPQDGYILRVTNRQVAITERGSEYYLLAEILDSDMRPTIIAPGCVESFHTAPVALFVSYSPRSCEPYCAPLMTSLAFREMSRHLRDTPLEQLRQEKCPSLAYALICAAIERRQRPSGNPQVELVSAQNTGTRLDFYLMPSVAAQVSREIVKIEAINQSFDPMFLITRDSGEGVQVSRVQLRRLGQFGQVSALVV